MTARSATAEVGFPRPFQFDGMERAQPAGVYRVTTDEEEVEGLSFLAWRTVGVFIEVPRPGGVEMVRVVPAELAAALAADVEVAP